LSLVTLAASVANATELQSVSRIAFGPENTLFIADWKAGDVVAVNLPPAPAATDAAFNITNLELSLRRAVGSSEITIEDMKARPQTDLVYVALSVGPTRRPEIVSVDPHGTVTKVRLIGLKTEKADLKDVVGWDYKFWGDIPERSFTVTDMQWHKGKLYVAGLSNQTFASTLRVLSYPFSGGQKMVSVEMFNTSHAQMETRAPIREMTFATLNGKDYLIAAYLCTPLVTIPVDEIQDGAHITGKTIAEMGYGNTPNGLLTFTANEMGKSNEYLLLSNAERNAELVPIEQVQAANEKPSMNQWVPFGKIDGVTPVQTPFSGVYRIDNLNAKFLVVLRRDLATGNSQLLTFDKAMRFRVSDFVAEYNFPGYEYKGQMQLTAIKPAEDMLKQEEGYPVTTDPLVNGPFPPK
jgi:hypothetical protein